MGITDIDVPVLFYIAAGLVGLAGIALLSVGVYLAQRGRRTVPGGLEKTLEPEPGGLPD